jgi:hypothetical protein
MLNAAIEIAFRPDRRGAGAQPLSTAARTGHHRPHPGARHPGNQRHRLLVLFGIAQASTAYFEVALLLALLGFVGTVALCKFLLRGDIIE